MDHDPSRRRVLGAVGLALASGLAGCNGGGGDADDGDGGGGNVDADATVAVGPNASNRFDPETVEISVGETVLWEWESDNHSVTPDSIPVDADWAGEEIRNTDHTYSHTFEVAGTYEYYCIPHQSQGMVGTVVVEEA